MTTNENILATWRDRLESAASPISPEDDFYEISLDCVSGFAFPNNLMFTTRFRKGDIIAPGVSVFVELPNVFIETQSQFGTLLVPFNQAAHGPLDEFLNAARTFVIKTGGSLAGGCPVMYDLRVDWPGLFDSAVERGCLRGACCQTDTGICTRQTKRNCSGGNREFFGNISYPYTISCGNTYPCGCACGRVRLARTDTVDFMTDRNYRATVTIDHLYSPQAYIDQNGVNTPVPTPPGQCDSTYQEVIALTSISSSNCSLTMSSGSGLTGLISLYQNSQQSPQTCEISLSLAPTGLSCAYTTNGSQQFLPTAVMQYTNFNQAEFVFETYWHTFVKLDAGGNCCLEANPFFSQNSQSPTPQQNIVGVPFGRMYTGSTTKYRAVIRLDALLPNPLP